jgi:hypothetical protein
MCGRSMEEEEDSGLTWMDFRRGKSREKHSYSIKKEKGRSKEIRRD